jgi:PKD repeat protein
LKKTSVIFLLGVSLLLLCLVYPVNAIGIFRNTNGNWSLDYNNAGVNDKTFHFGKLGDIPVIGDWNKDGISDVGVFRPSTGNWYLDTTKTGVVNKTFQFGKTGDIPVIGDWNGDGASDAGVFRPSNGNWYLDTTKTGVVNKTFQFGKTGDLPKALPLPPAAPVAAFTSDVQSGNAPLTVRFTDSSTGTAPLTYAWDFTNDGVNGNMTRNPSFKYSTPGTYTVKLTVTNSVGNDSEIKNGYITVHEVPVAPVANFFANKRSGNAPLTVRFTDSSTGTAPLTYVWDFTDDGEEDSDNKDPIFTYDTPGTYTVKLTVTNNVDTDVERKTGYITVTEGQPIGSPAGVALTFDDDTIDQWTAIRGLLQPYNAHVTFFISQFEHLDEDQIDKLRTLKADGHEIAFHGSNHEDAAAYLKNHTIQQYLDYEIIPGVNLMKDAGLAPVDFAYPYGAEDDSLTAALQAYFVHVRGTQSQINDPIFYEYGSNQLLIEGVGIDDLTYGNTMNDIYEGISNAKQEDKILIFYAHEPVQTVTEKYTISYDRLEKILINVSEQDMRFYTVSELA